MLSYDSTQADPHITAAAQIFATEQLADYIRFPARSTLQEYIRQPEG